MGDAEDSLSTDSVDFSDSIDRHRVDIVQSLDLERHFVFTYLRSKSVLDEDDCEIILNCGAGRKQKVSKFLDVLGCKGPEAYKHFVDSLEVEFPQLYKKITGKHPKKLNPVDTLQRFSSTLWTGGPAAKEWIDFDRQFLSKQLESTTTELQSLAFVHNRMVHEKNILEKKVLEATSDLESREEQMNDLREQLETTKSRSIPNQTKTAESSKAVQRYIQELMAENADKSNKIISLQQSLLEMVGNAEKDKIASMELRRRHEEALQQLRDVTVNYDFERRNSLKMTEKMRKQTDQIKQGDDLRRELFELKLRLSEMREERDEAREELREFRNVTEALNAKFDCVRQEKDQAIEFQEVCSSTVFELKEEKEVLHLKLQEAYLDLNDLRRKNMRLTEDCKSLKGQRDVLMQEREMAVNERVVAEKERDEAVRMKHDLQQSRDESIEAQIRINKALHDDYCKLHEEMDIVRADLRMITEQNELQRLKLREFENANQIVPMKAENAETEPGCAEGEVLDKSELINNVNATNDEDRNRAFDSFNNNSNDASSEEKDSVPTPFPWKKDRSSTAILNSAYRRIQSGQPDNFFKHRTSMPAILDCCNTSAGGDNVPMLIREDVTAAKKDVAGKKKMADKNLKIDVTAARALQISIGSMKGTSGQPKEEHHMLNKMVPAISALSMNLAMTSGSQESSSGEGRSCSPIDYLKSPDIKRSIPPGKSVSPKVLYKVDTSSRFDFEEHVKDKKQGGQTWKRSVSAGSGKRREARSGGSDDACGKPGRKSKNGKRSIKQKTTSFSQAKDIERSNSSLETLAIATQRRWHSSGDLAVLIQEAAHSSAV